jgi:hypothetical protein
MPDLSIIIVTWNSEGHIVDCLRAIDISGTTRSHGVIIVDNNSRDETVASVKRFFPDVNVVTNRENVGFAAAANQAIRLVKSPYVCLLNPDTAVQAGALDSMAAFLDAHEDVWAVGPALLHTDLRPRTTGVRFPTNWNILMESFFLDRAFPRSRLFGRHKELFEDLAKPRAVDYLEGACLMVRCEAIERVGELDEGFFLYFEEADWCYRMRRAGGLVYFLPPAKVVHATGMDPGHFDELRLVHYHRSLLFFYRKHYSIISRLVVRVILSVRSCIRICVWCIGGMVRPSLRVSALSSVRGYLRVFGFLLRPVSP